MVPERVRGILAAQVQGQVAVGSLLSLDDCPQGGKVKGLEHEVFVRTQKVGLAGVGTLEDHVGFNGFGGDGQQLFPVLRMQHAEDGLIAGIGAFGIPVVVGSL